MIYAGTEHQTLIYAATDKQTLLYATTDKQALMYAATDKQTYYTLFIQYFTICITPLYNIIITLYRKFP